MGDNSMVPMVAPLATLVAGTFMQADRNGRAGHFERQRRCVPFEPLNRESVATVGGAMVVRR